MYKYDNENTLLIDEKVKESVKEKEKDQKKIEIEKDEKN